MSRIRADKIVDRSGSGAPEFPYGIVVSGVVTATVFDQSVSGIVSATGGFNIGIQSAGVSIANTITTLNFVGAGNTFIYDPETKTVDISISGSGSGSGGQLDPTGITTQTFFSNPNVVSTAQTLTYPNHNYGMFGPVSLNATVTVGVGNTLVIV